MRDLNFYRDLFEAREFNNVNETSFLAYVLESEKHLDFNPYEVEEEFNQALNVYGLKIDKVSYAMHPILGTLFTFISERIVN